MTRQFYDSETEVSEPSPQEDPPVNPIWKPDYDREPKWKDMNDEDLELFFDKIKESLTDSGEIDNVDWERLNFEMITSDFYREHIGEGFPDEFYELLAKSTNEENKIQDFRQPALDIKREEVILTFSTKPDDKN